jgi:mono/diheme cytochrome c family protein
VGIFLLAILAVVAYVNFSSPPTYDDIAAPDLTVQATPELVAHGQVLVEGNCQGCHHAADGPHLAGRLFEDKAANEAFGAIYTANITQHPESALAGYSDGELYRLLRTGVKKNGEKAIAVMPVWPLAADEDIHAIIAFLRSSHPWVAAADVAHPIHQPSFLEKALTRFVFAPTPYQDNYPERPPLSDSVAYGAYQVNAVNLCYYCHSENIETANALVPEDTPGYLAGGFTFRHNDYDLLVPGLLLKEGNNVNQWSVEEFVDAVKFGIRPGLPAYKEPMHPFNLLDTAEVRAIYQYLAEATK